MKPQALVPVNEFYPTMQLTKPHWTTYGLGWFQQDYRGKMIQFHTGSLDGAVAIIGLIPDEHFGIYIFENLDHAELRHALMFKAFDLWAFHDDSKRSEEHTSELQSPYDLVCRLLLEKKKKKS